MQALVARGVIGILLVFAIGPASAAPVKEAERERIAALIAQLGDGKIARRDAAKKELVAIGENALPALRLAVANPDFEIHTRSKQLIRVIMLNSCKSKTTGLKLALIDPGIFQMGSPRIEPGRRPDENLHRAQITHPFLMGVYEVTQDEYQQVMKVNPSWFTATGGGKVRVTGQKTERFPVERVTWFDAVEFCNQLSKQDGYEPYYKLTDPKRADDSIASATVTILGGTGYRLPTETEWEFAARAGTTTPFHFGRECTGEEGNVKAMPPTGYGSAPRRADLNRSIAVGSYKPNEWGLYDMHGNVGEWCWDWYDKDYANASEKNHTGPERGTHRLARGGSWLVSYGSCRAASRLFFTPDERNYHTGFRVARTP